jgi:hemerythrin superfamily protein
MLFVRTTRGPAVILSAGRGRIMQSKDKNTNAISILKEDHQKVKDLFFRFEETNGSATKAKIVAEALMALKVHATIEEELFYPAVRQHIEDDEGIMDEADEEHHVAKVLIAELEKMTGDEGHWEAKFKVLAESVRHHIKEEEGKLFKEARKTDIDFGVLGSQMAQLKQKLMREGVPEDAEAKMIAKCGLRGDSPAKKAQEKLEVPMRKAS